MPKYFVSAYAIPHIHLGGLEKTLRMLFRSTVKINIVLTAIILMLLGMSLMSMNTSTSAGHDMTLLQEQEKSLTEQNTALRAELANLQAMDTVEARVQNLGLTKIVAIDYIKKVPPTLAYLK